MIAMGGTGRIMKGTNQGLAGPPVLTFDTVIACLPANGLNPKTDQNWVLLQPGDGEARGNFLRMRSGQSLGTSSRDPVLA